MTSIGELIVKVSTIKNWYDVWHVALEAEEYRMKYVRGFDDKKEYRLYKKTDIGFCFHDNCTGVDPTDAFIQHIKEKSPEFMVTIKSTF